MRTVSAGSHFSATVVSAGSNRSRTVSAEVKYDGQSWQEATTSRLVYTLWFTQVDDFCDFLFASLEDKTLPSVLPKEN